MSNGSFDFLDSESQFPKLSAVNPLIRSSAVESGANGFDVQSPLTANPYSTSPKDAEEYENGYQYAQSIGHQGLNAADDTRYAAWNKRSKPWQEGFTAASNSMGVGVVQQKLSFVEARPLNYLSGGSGFGVGADLGLAAAREDVSMADLPKKELDNLRINGRALGSLAGGILGTIGGLGYAAYEQNPTEWGNDPWNTAKNISTGATLGVVGGITVPMLYAAPKVKALAEREAAKM